MNLTRIMDKDFQKRQSTNNEFLLYFSVIPAKAGIHNHETVDLRIRQQVAMA